MALDLHPLQAGDIQEMVGAFTAIGWDKPAALYQRYLAEQDAGDRAVILASVNNQFAGYITVKWLSDYPPFLAGHIPEISDFNVLPHLRRQGIGGHLMDEAERIAAERSAMVGIGVGLYSDYGAAQRMYVKRGYIPDGRGLFAHGQFVRPGQQVTVDDNLTLYFTRRLRD